ncbi:hypothetical protein HBI64_011540 [Parastagonospora nodorum]|nr:hypothetical protein HBI67_143620 [Parastagonospora nodorum]KAH6087021.1 hypothetical protein HBI66_043510 [Parastagonospora nodorum]KAH6145471.1 hypothetical protein HBI64_011540 [Parastagonospora nodorum]
MSLPASPSETSGAMSEHLSSTPQLQVLQDRASSSSTADQDPRPTSSSSTSPPPPQDKLLAEAFVNLAPVMSSSSQKTGEIYIFPAVVILDHADTTTLDDFHDEDAAQPGPPDVTPQHNSFSIPALTKGKHEDFPSRASSPPALNDEAIGNDSRQPRSQGVEEPAHRMKRKHRDTLAERDDKEIGVEEVTAPRAKKMKVYKDPEPDKITSTARPEKMVSPKKKPSARTRPRKDRVAKSTSAPKIGRSRTWRNQDHGKMLDTLANQEQKRMLTAQNSHLAAMQKAPGYETVTQVAATVEVHQNNINKVKVQIKHIASALGPGTNRNRDVGGKTNKFDRQDAHIALNTDSIGAWTGSKWQDEQNENMTWFRIPAKQKTLSLAGRMVPMAEIIAKSAKFPEFTLMRKEMTENSKTGKKEVGFYTITYEKLEPEQATARGEVLLRQAKAEATQRKKDEAAERCREARGGAAPRKKSCA